MDWWMIMLSGLAFLAALALLAEIAMRLAPMPLDFYSSVSRLRVRQLQQEFGVQPHAGPGWVHLAWAADPQGESYEVEFLENGIWKSLGKASFGSFLQRSAQKGMYRVWVMPKDGSPRRLLGEAHGAPVGEAPPCFIPRISGTWQLLFRPQKYGNYINDHTIFQDASGDWRLVGITSRTRGDFNAERYFAVGSSRVFPPEEGMTEEQTLADLGELAWAPHVIRNAGNYHMFWSPHKLHQMDSTDGIHWCNHRISLPAPFHKYFRDPMVLQVAERQWLLYTTGRGFLFSRVDIYQSFNLEDWQYIGAALRNTWGSEHNSAYASSESPTVYHYMGRYYLSVTFNNETPVIFGLLLLLKIWPWRASYNNTRVFHSENPYDFGVHAGKKRSPTLVTALEVHAPEWVYVPETDRWYITSAGWPWVSTLTRGEAAVAPLEFIEQWKNPASQFPAGKTGP